MLLFAVSCVSKHIESALNNEYMDAWQSRARVDFVIMVDWNSEASLLEPGGHVRSLKDAIYKVTHFVVPVSVDH